MKTLKQVISMFRTYLYLSVQLGLISGTAFISEGTRVAYNGTTWQPVSPPTIPYAEEARMFLLMKKETYS